MKRCLEGRYSNTLLLLSSNVILLLNPQKTSSQSPQTLPFSRHQETLTSREEKGRNEASVVAFGHREGMKGGAAVLGRRWSQELLHLLPPFTGRITAEHETAPEREPGGGRALIRKVTDIRNGPGLYR